MTSSTRRSRRLRMFLSMRLSSGEKPVSAALPFEQHLAGPSGSRSGSSRTLRAAAGSTTTPDFPARRCRRGAAKARHRRSRPAGVLVSGHGRQNCRTSHAVSSIMAGHRDRRCPGVARISRSSRFHVLGLAVGLMIVSQKMQKTMNGEMREVMRYRPPLLARFANDGLAGDGDVAEVDGADGSGAPRSVPAAPETTARWSASSRPRHWALRAAIVASSHRSTATSAAGSPTSVGGSAAPVRSPRAPRLRRQARPPTAAIRSRRRLSTPDGARRSEAVIL